MTTIRYTAWGEDFDLMPNLGRYSNGRLAISLVTEHEPFSHLTVNLPDEHLAEGEFFIKTWGENEALVPHLVEAGWLIPTGREVSSGFVFPAVMRVGSDLLEFLDSAPEA